MKIRTNLINIALFVAVLGLSQLSACSLAGQAPSTPTLYWSKSSEGTIATNDVARLRKEIPFSIILPEYLPGGPESYKLDMLFHTLIEQVPILSIDYYSLTTAREIHITESQPSDPYPKPLDYTPIELAGVAVLENRGYGEVIRNAKTIQVSGINYIWERNDLVFSVRVLGYGQADARKIVESMIK